MMKNVKIKGLPETDKVFKHEECHVRLRIVEGYVGDRASPYAIILTCTACPCDETGKPFKCEGEPMIMPHKETIQLDHISDGFEAKKHIEASLQSLIERTARWHKSLCETEKFVIDWKKKKLSQKRITRKNN